MTKKTFIVLAILSVVLVGCSAGTPQAAEVLSVTVESTEAAAQTTPGGGLGNPGADQSGVLAGVLGLTKVEFHDLLATGLTVAEIAEEQGKDVDAVLAEMVGHATSRIETAVADGSMDRVWADGMLLTLNERMQEKVYGDFMGGGGFGAGQGLGQQAGAMSGLQDCTGSGGQNRGPHGPGQGAGA